MDIDLLGEYNEKTCKVLARILNIYRLKGIFDEITR